MASLVLPSPAPLPDAAVAALNPTAFPYRTAFPAAPPHLAFPSDTAFVEMSPNAMHGHTVAIAIPSTLLLSAPGSRFAAALLPLA